MAEPEALAFDMYGTLVDPIRIWKRLEGYVPDEDALRIAEVWRQKQLEFTFRLTVMERYEDFEEMLLVRAPILMELTLGKLRSSVLTSYGSRAIDSISLWGSQHMALSWELMKIRSMRTSSTWKRNLRVLK